MLQRLHRKGEQWLGKDIAFVQREQQRLFPVGDQCTPLQPDVFVMFTDGDWLAIEVVYTHRPEMKHQDAYASLSNGDDHFGPRVVVIDLNDEISEIDEDSHRLWVREGGVECALAREASKFSHGGIIPNGGHPLEFFHLVIKEPIKSIFVKIQHILPREIDSLPVKICSKWIYTMDGRAGCVADRPGFRGSQNRRYCQNDGPDEARNFAADRPPSL